MPEHDREMTIDGHDGPRPFSLHVQAAQADRFDTMCRDLGVAYRIGSRVRLRDWRGNHPVRPGRTFIFDRREDVERVLAWEQRLAAAGQPG